MGREALLVRRGSSADRVLLDEQENKAGGVLPIKRGAMLVEYC